MTKLNIIKGKFNENVKFYGEISRGFNLDADGLGNLSIAQHCSLIGYRQRYKFFATDKVSKRVVHSGHYHKSFIAAYNDMVKYLKSQQEIKPKPNQKRRTIAVESLERLVDVEQSDRILHSLLMRNDHRNPSFSWDWYEEMREKVRSNLRIAAVDARITLKVQLEHR